MRVTLPSRALARQANAVTKPGHWALVARLYRERYGSPDDLELERYARPPLPLGPVTPEQACRNFRLLYAAVRDLPPCAACRRPRRSQAAPRPYISRGIQ